MRRSYFGWLAVAAMLAGCAAGGGDSAGETAMPSDSVPPAVQTESVQPAAEADGFPGTYTVPDGWVKAEEYSTDETAFYVEAGQETEETPDNISVYVGSNRYSAEEHTAFRDAIFQQLAMQIQFSGVEAELSGSGGFTEQGYPLYTFTIDEGEDGPLSRQYYIVDDYRYCMVYLTNFSGAEGPDEAAQTMVDSFVWSDSAGG